MTKLMYRPQQKVNGKQILSYIASLGDKNYYEVECLKCNRKLTMSEVSIKKHKGCRQCNSSRGMRRYKND